MVTEKVREWRRWAQTAVMQARTGAWVRRGVRVHWGAERRGGRKGGGVQGYAAYVRARLRVVAGDARAGAGLGTCGRRAGHVRA